MAEGIERQEKIKELCNQASRLAPEKRAVFLAQACAGDEELRHEIESLLRFDHTDDGLLNRTAWKHIAGDLVADETDALIGKQIGHYQIQSLLGAGGMGKVFLAHDLQLGRQVAIKFLPAHFTSDPERLRRFEQEARAASALNHENIITIHEIGKQDHWQFIVMEYLDGQTLRERMKQVRFDSNATIEIALQVTAALAAAHQAGIVHRDVKPENIMVSAENKVKVLDFGIAKLTERNGETGQARRGETATGRMGRSRAHV